MFPYFFMINWIHLKKVFYDYDALQGDIVAYINVDCGVPRDFIY